MTRITFTDESGTLTWFDGDAAQWYPEGREYVAGRWIGPCSQREFVFEQLARTAKGRWVLHTDASAVCDGPNWYRYIDPHAARDWLLRAGDYDSVIEKYLGGIDDEPDPAGGEGHAEHPRRLIQVTLNVSELHARESGMDTGSRTTPYEAAHRRLENTIQPPADNAAASRWRAYADALERSGKTLHDAYASAYAAYAAAWQHTAHDLSRTLGLHVATTIDYSPDSRWWNEGAAQCTTTTNPLAWLVFEHVLAKLGRPHVGNPADEPNAGDNLNG